MMKNILTIISMIGCLCINVKGQVYNDYIGAGHSAGIIVTTSSSMNANTTGAKTLDGSGLDNPRMEASRFLAQATVGYELSHIDEVMNMGYQGWIDDQFTKPASYLTPQMWDIWQQVKDIRFENGLDTTDIFGPFSVHFNYTLFTSMMMHDDQLRHRVAQALSEILVISMQSDIGSWAEGLTSYYDMLMQHSFGNYKDLLLATTKHPIMGYYLSHINNPKTNLSLNIRPDENFAREIMQLFSIGLHQLNIDGTPKRDANGNLIPTYDNNDIKELAKVFTGMGAGAILNPNEWPYVPIFGVGMWAIDKTVPMQMFQSEHEAGPKVMLKDVTINMPGNGMGEVNAAVDYLFNHPNVGPFISHKLIQRLVKSNPSPAYIQRVAQIFNNNGNGVRGDMKAVIKAILLDEEARNGEYMDQINAGMIRPPFLRAIQFMRSADIDVPTGRYWNNGFSYYDAAGHWPLNSPSVFNFYLPNHQPQGAIADNDLYAPELKLHNTSSAVRYINQIFIWTVQEDWGGLWWDWEPDETPANSGHVVLDEWVAMADEPEKIINTLDVYLTHGQLSEETRQYMRESINSVYWTWDDGWKEERVKLLLQQFLVCPDFVTLK